MILCKVYRGLTEIDEKDLFIKQEGISKTVSTMEKLRAEYNSGTYNVVDMVECAKIVGCTIDFDKLPSKARNRINAVVTAYKAYNTLGHDHFINLLSILSKSFYGEQNGFNDGFIKGMCYLLKHHASEFTIGDMVSSIQRQPIDYYQQRANSFNGSAEIRNAKAFAEQYNKKRSTRRIKIELS